MGDLYENAEHRRSSSLVNWIQDMKNEMKVLSPRSRATDIYAPSLTNVDFIETISDL